MEGAGLSSAVTSYFIKHRILLTGVVSMEVIGIKYRETSFVVSSRS